MLRTRARDNGCFVALCNAVGGQDELIFDGHSVVLDDEGERDRARARLRGVAARRRRRPGRRDRSAAARRAPARARAGAARAPPTRVAERRREHGGARAGGAFATSSSRCGRRSSSGCATTCARTASARSSIGVSGGIDSALTAALAASALGPGARALRLDAVALLLRGDAHRRAAARREPRHATSASCRSSRRRGVRGVARGVVRRPRARPRRGEPAGADPRHAADGALEQVRLARWSRPGTSPRCRSATRRSTATWPAASRSSRTCSRRTSSGLRAT